MNHQRTLHKPTLRGDGKWETVRGLKRYKIKRRRLNKLARKARHVR